MLKRLSVQTLERLRVLQITQLSPIQEACFKPIVEGKKVIAVSPQGTGKTLAYLLPIWQRALTEKLRPENTLIILPSSHLVRQHEAIFDRLCEPHLGLTTVSKLEKTKAKIVVVDEADKVFPNVYAFDKFMHRVPSQSQVILMAAQPLKIDPPGFKIIRRVEQRFKFYALKVGDNLRELLPRLVADHGKTLIFANTVAEVEEWGTLLRFPKIHGKMTADQREHQLSLFRVQNPVLICDNTLARGIDIPEISWVIGLHPTSGDLAHKVGRSARGPDALGKMLILYRDSEMKAFLQLKKTWNIQDYKLPPLEQTDQESLVARVREVHNFAGALPAAEALLAKYGESIFEKAWGALDQAQVRSLLTGQPGYLSFLLTDQNQSRLGLRSILQKLLKGGSQGPPLVGFMSYSQVGWVVDIRGDWASKFEESQEELPKLLGVPAFRVERLRELPNLVPWKSTAKKSWSPRLPLFKARARSKRNSRGS